MKSGYSYVQWRRPSSAYRTLNTYIHNRACIFAHPAGMGTGMCPAAVPPHAPVPPPCRLFLCSPACTPAFLGTMQASAARAAHSTPLQQQRQQQCPGRPAAACLARRRAVAAVRAAASAAPDGQQPQPAGLRITSGVELPSQGQASFPAGSPHFDVHIAIETAFLRHEQAVLLPRRRALAAAHRSCLCTLHPFCGITVAGGGGGGGRYRLHQPAADGDPGAENRLSGGGCWGQGRVLGADAWGLLA